MGRASHVLTPRLAQKDTLDLARSVTDPEVRALLLVEVVDHDFMLNVVEEHGAAIGVRRSARDGLRARVVARSRWLEFHIVRARSVRVFLHDWSLVAASGLRWAATAGSFRLLSLEVATETHPVDDGRDSF